MASEVLLTFGAWMIVIIAWNFRRDQFVNFKIREYAKVIGKGKIFPESYDPRHKFPEKREWRTLKCFSWMPDMMVLFYLLFPVFQILLFVSYWSSDTGKVSKEFGVVVIVLMLCPIIYVPLNYYSKGVKFFKKIT
ncbi:MAG: hypothetical protein HY890_04290 [Deltaproteobacteria bacterium]|nr:hypothetical protein [Deltaproteobacteria bacterium]